MLRMDVAERRRRLAVRHALSPSARAGDPVAVARRLVALHATDPASVFLAIAARTDGVSAPDIEDALYGRRELVRMLGMRRTMFVVPSELRSVIEASTMARIADAQRRLLLKHLGQAGIPDTERWLEDVGKGVLRALAGRGGTASAVELAEDEPRLRTPLVMAAGKPYAAVQNITSRVLVLLGAQGHIVRGRPTGSWLSQRYRWALTDTWLAGPGGTDRLPSPAEARTELARRWLTSFGPAPISDLQWWTGWTGADVKHAIAPLRVVEVDLGDVVGVVHAGDVEPTGPVGPWAALLPALDPTVMGWSKRDWFVGDHVGALFDRSGNAGPTAWLDGRVVGGWGQRGDGEIAVKLFDDVGADGVERLHAEARQLDAWLDGTRITPRFRTPTERELSGPPLRR